MRARQIGRNTPTDIDCSLMITEDDINMLKETEDEFHRKGNFERLFPYTGCEFYLKYFSSTPHNDRLLSQWSRLSSEHEIRVEMLQKFSIPNIQPFMLNILKPREQGKTVHQKSFRPVLI
ncbi:hypothetical protein HK096_004111 [Nowakowskiella sp. JEL0078]|nr:hypothetical protein HK096_004111 [Nowakowskiella sp. JEL0078]